MKIAPNLVNSQSLAEAIMMSTEVHRMAPEQHTKVTRKCFVFFFITKFTRRPNEGYTTALRRSIESAMRAI